MKIHLDYLEGRVEELESANMKLLSDKKSYGKKYVSLEDKYKLIQAEYQSKSEENSKLRERIDQLEKRYKELKEADAAYKASSAVNMHNRS